MGRVASADFVHPTTRGRRENYRVDAVRQRTSPQRDRQNGEQNAAQGHYLSAYGVKSTLANWRFTTCRTGADNN
jgi:hypothetical protein